MEFDDDASSHYESFSDRAGQHQSSGSSSSTYSHEDGHVGTSSGSDTESYSSESSYEAKVFDPLPLKRKRSSVAHLSNSAPDEKEPPAKTAKVTRTRRPPAKKASAVKPGKSMPRRKKAANGKRKATKKSRKGRKGGRGRKGAGKKDITKLSKQLTNINKVVKRIRKSKK